MDNELVPQGFGSHLGSLGPSYICLCIPGEMVCDHQNILIQAFSRFQAQIVKVNQLQGMCGHDVFKGGFGCLALKARHRWHFLRCSFTWAAMQGQKNLSCMRLSMHPRPKWPTSSWHPLRATSFCVAAKTNWRRVSSDSLGWAHLYRTPFLSSKLLHSCQYLLTLGVYCLGLAFP